MGRLAALHNTALHMYSFMSKECAVVDVGGDDDHWSEAPPLHNMHRYGTLNDVRRKKPSPAISMRESCSSRAGLRHNITPFLLLVFILLNALRYRRWVMRSLWRCMLFHLLDKSITWGDVLPYSHAYPAGSSYVSFLPVNLCGLVFLLSSTAPYPTIN